MKNKLSEYKKKRPNPEKALFPSDEIYREFVHAYTLTT
jgi:hypothetical protein